MRRSTGIELGPDQCAIVALVRRRGRVTLEVARLFGPEEWPTREAEQIELLRTTRLALGLPRNASLVVWAGVRSPAPSSGAGRRNMTPEEAAGFELDDALTPAEGLLHLSTTRGRPAGEQAVAWLALNRRGGALAIVRGGSLLHSREFEWRISAPEERLQAHLLRRYLLVPQLVPHLRAAIATVRDEHDAAVDAAVACGSLPDLRSLTLPLIEELDIEIETLDAPADWLETGSDTAGAAPPPAAMQLARAAAERLLLGSPSRLPWWMRVAALVLAAGAGWWGFTAWSRWTAGPDGLGEARQTATARGTAPVMRPAEGAQPPPAPSDSGPAMRRPVQPEPTTGAFEPDAAARPVQPEASQPAVSGILIAPDRRLAVIDGSVVGVGDRVGRRAVIRIDADAVVLREDSGRELRLRVPRAAATLR